MLIILNAWGAITDESVSKQNKPQQNVAPPVQ